MRGDERYDDPADAHGDEAKGCLDDGEALVVLVAWGWVSRVYPVGARHLQVRYDDEIVVERCEEEQHDDHCGREFCVAEYRDFHQRSTFALVLKVPLPADKSGDDQERDANQGSDPWGGPAFDVSFGQSE